MENETNRDILRARASSISQIVDPDVPTVTNEHGGSQSDIRVRFDLIDGKALFKMAEVLDYGAIKYGEDNWRKIPINDHLNHLLMHVYAYLSGDETDDHLSHILCRATFALGVKLQEETYD
ncbi:MAG: dATP/dGTP diphosphohydrolase domain-containing protein [Paenisporosarcina sp.]